MIKSQQNFPIDNSIQLHTTFFLVPGCDSPSLVANGFCNDETNNADCIYDDGECCDLNANTDFCSECACHLVETCAAGYHPLVENGFCNDETNIADCNYDGGDCCSNPNMIGDGICHDETNYPDCVFDGGDCCLVNVNTDSCSDCNCLASGVIMSPGFPENYDNNLDLTWLIQLKMGKTIELNFLSFAVESHPTCV